MSAPAHHASWVIREFHPGDEPRLVALFQRAFGRSISEAHWRWKLHRLPSPVANDWLALDGERAVFHSGGIPLRYRIPSGEVTALVSVDTMTDPDYRRRGLLTQVAGTMYQSWREGRIPFVIGLINEQWGSRAPALGWEKLFPLHWMIRPVKPEALLARRLGLAAIGRVRLFESLWNGVWNARTSGDNRIRTRPIHQAGPEFDRLWERCADDVPVGAVRDSAWVEWRFLSCPSSSYRVLLAERGSVPVGYVAFRLERALDRTVGYVADLLAPRDDSRAVDTLIARALQALRAEGAEVAATQIPAGTWLYPAFRRAGFLWSWGAFSVEAVPLAPDLPLEMLRDPRSWHMTGADYDSI